MDKISVQHMKFVDESGRERIFNGMNMVFKGEQGKENAQTNYIPEWNEKQFQWLQENGFNLIRLGIIWDGIEHEKGVYNEEYIDWLERMLYLCETYGIYAYLDMHQDLYSVCYSDGAPEWATLAEGREHVEGELWSDAYLFSDAVKRAFENFWDNKEVEEGQGLLDYYAKTWSYVINRVKDHPAVIGYDFLNEPFPGECSLEIFGTLLGAYGALTGKEMSLEELVGAFSNPESKRMLLQEFDDKELYTQMARSAEELLKIFDTTRLRTFYQHMTEAIRKMTSEGIIMMENSYFSNLGIPCNLPVLENTRGEREPLQAYAPHGYDLVVDTADIVYASNNRVDVIFDTHREVQKRLCVPVIVGEWGAHAMYAEGMGHIEHLLDKFDDYKWSNTYWCYHGGIEEAPVMTKLNRPYPRAVCGDILSYKYDRKYEIFTVEWIEKEGEESIIYVHKMPQSIQLDGLEVKELLDEESKTIRVPNQGLANRMLKVSF